MTYTHYEPLTFQAFTLIGVVDDLPQSANNGDIYVVGGNNYVWIDGSWFEIDGFGSNQTDEPSDLTEMKCQNCGAPLTRIDRYHCRCEYCEAVYENK